MLKFVYYSMKIITILLNKFNLIFWKINNLMSKNKKKISIVKIANKWLRVIVFSAIMMVIYTVKMDYVFVVFKWAKVRFKIFKKINL
jgi:hypothetical protein